jgi:hypothetical protein
MLGHHLATFSVDASPPIGHPLCGGWIKPTVSITDPLRLRGVVILGSGLPIVLATLDWTGVQNESYRILTEALAEAAHTTPDRVALHSAHQHNAPFVDHVGNALLAKAGLSPLLFDESFFDDLVRRSAAAVRDSLTPAKPVSHIRIGRAEVSRVASNRRILGPDGKIKYVRYSSNNPPPVRDAPEGTIDPMLKSISFYQMDRPLARLYYYTTHPMSYYGDGRVTSDFVGIARDRRDRDEPEILHLYFTGSAGNVTAGKYNDGTQADRENLTAHVHRAMTAADTEADARTRNTLRRLDAIRWTTAPIVFKPREDLDLDQLRAVATDPKGTSATRNHSAMTFGWLSRCAQRRPILLSRLDLADDVTILNLPAETFVEYQLEAQKLRPDRFLATAAYGDGGPWYIPRTRSFDEGGYEPTVALVSPSTEPMYRKAIADLLKA